MSIKAVCSQCGHRLVIVQNGDDFEPVDCESCGSIIVGIKSSPTSNDFLAIVE